MRKKKVRKIRVCQYPGCGRDLTSLIIKASYCEEHRVLGRKMYLNQYYLRNKKLLNARRTVQIREQRLREKLKKARNQSLLQEQVKELERDWDYGDI